MGVVIEYMVNDQVRRAKAGTVTALMNGDVVAAVRRFHERFPEYRMTPLHRLNELAKAFGVGEIWVKDESHRFGLNAFKVLGGSYAIGKYVAERLNIDMAALSFEKLKSNAIKEKLGALTFVTATDGNHGRGIAWAARQLGQKSVVYMPKGSSEIRLNHIRKEGAEAFITDLNYDDTVRLARQKAEENGWILVQDTAWEGYEKIPGWIMQGYGTLLDEALEQMAAAGAGQPTHVFLQAGVGSFPSSMVGAFVERLGENRPLTVIVEPENAACFYQSMAAGDGEPHAVKGDLHTIMAGLACGVPSRTSWEILKTYGDIFVACSDEVAARGMRILANPLGGDPAIISGESGAAVGIGLLSFLAAQDKMKHAFKLKQEAKILIISTEGATDPDNYRKIVWDGAYPTV